MSIFQVSNSFCSCIISEHSLCFSRILLLFFIGTKNVHVWAPLLESSFFQIPNFILVTTSIFTFSNVYAAASQIHKVLNCYILFCCRSSSSLGVQCPWSCHICSFAYIRCPVSLVLKDFLHFVVSLFSGAQCPWLWYTCSVVDFCVQYPWTHDFCSYYSSSEAFSDVSASFPTVIPHQASFFPIVVGGVRLSSASATSQQVPSVLFHPVSLSPTVVGGVRLRSSAHIVHPVSPTFLSSLPLYFQPGIINSHSSCWINSALQALRAIFHFYLNSTHSHWLLSLLFQLHSSAISCNFDSLLVRFTHLILLAKLVNNVTLFNFFIFFLIFVFNLFMLSLPLLLLHYLNTQCHCTYVSVSTSDCLDLYLPNSLHSPCSLELALFSDYSNCRNYH